MGEMKALVRVRDATAADAACLAELGAATFAETFAAENSADDLRTYIAASFGARIQARELADPKERALLAEVDGDAAGYAKLKWSAAPEGVRASAPIELARIYVLARFHGSGVGAALMRACLARSRALGADAIWLGVWERNARAIAFYERFGFAVCDEHDFVLGADRQRDLVMARAVDPDVPSERGSSARPKPR